jgi:hypothetical protein
MAPVEGFRDDTRGGACRRRSSLGLPPQSHAELDSVARTAFLEISPRRSFPRKRESSLIRTDLDPRLRGGDNKSDFHPLWRAAGPRILCRNSRSDGRLAKKKRCASHMQSDEPNPEMGMEAPGSALNI